MRMKHFIITGAFFCTPLNALAQQSPVFSGFEEREQAVCAGDGDGAWVRNAAVYTYFKDSYYDLDVHFRAFIGTAVANVKTTVAMKDKSKKRESYAFMHDRAQGLIVGMGRLLPRVERALDLRPMTVQMLESTIWDPQSDGHGEFLRVALASEMLDVAPEIATDPGARIAAFLTYFSVVEGLLFELKTEPDNDKNVQALMANLDALQLGWRDGFRPIANTVIFSGSPEAFAERLTKRVGALCNARRTCTTDSLDEPLDCGSELQEP